MFLRYAFLADHVTIDAVGKLSAIGIFDIVHVITLPSLHRELFIAGILEGSVAEKGSHFLSGELRDRKANKVWEFKIPFELTAPGVGQGTLRAGFSVQVRDLIFQRAGVFEFVLFVNDRFVGRIPLLVNLRRPSEKG